MIPHRLLLPIIAICFLFLNAKAQTEFLRIKIPTTYKKTKEANLKDSISYLLVIRSKETKPAVSGKVNSFSILLYKTKNNKRLLPPLLNDSLKALHPLIAKDYLEKLDLPDALDLKTFDNDFKNELDNYLQKQKIVNSNFPEIDTLAYQSLSEERKKYNVQLSLQKSTMKIKIPKVFKDSASKAEAQDSIYYQLVISRQPDNVGFDLNLFTIQKNQPTKKWDQGFAEILHPLLIRSYLDSLGIADSLDLTELNSNCEKEIIKYQNTLKLSNLHDPERKICKNLIRLKFSNWYGLERVI
jgi:hypothetical protein